MRVGVPVKIRVVDQVSQRPCEVVGHLKGRPCSERWGMGIALVWILKVNFYKFCFLGLEHTVLLPFLPAHPGLDR